MTLIPSEALQRLLIMLICAVGTALNSLDGRGGRHRVLLSSRPPLCDPSARIEGGHWDISSERENTDWNSCPGALSWVQGNYQLKYQVEQYACSNEGTYYSAAFRRADSASSCRHMGYKEAVAFISSVFLRKLRSPLINVFVVGDSIGGQYAIAAKCAAEMAGVNETVQVDYWHDHTLRNDVPCFVNCTIPEFRKQFHWMCSRCERDGSAPPFQREAEQYFANMIPVATNVLVITAGVWYNNFKFSNARPEQLYNVTLQLTAPVLKNMVKRGIIVVWVALPFNEGGSDEDKRRYGWDTFSAKDESAKFFLKDTGVIFVDANAAIRKRVKSDALIFKNYTIHYCSPGPSSIPVFVNTIIMQHIAHALSGNILPYYSG